MHVLCLLLQLFGRMSLGALGISRVAKGCPRRYCLWTIFPPPPSPAVPLLRPPPPPHPVPSHAAVPRPPQGMQEQQAILGEVSEHVVCTYGDAFPPGPDSLTYKLESPGAVAAWVLGVVADCFGRGQCAGAADFDYLFETEAQRLDLDRVLWGIAHFHSVGTEALSKAMLPLFVLRRLPELEATLRGARDADAVCNSIRSRARAQCQISTRIQNRRQNVSICRHSKFYYCFIYRAPDEIEF